MNRNKQFFWIGLLSYALSFLLIAAGPFDATKPLHGYFCASVTLLFFWEQAKLWVHGAPFIYNPLEYFSVLASAWINPVFLAALAIASLKPSNPFFRFARTILILMIPVCWIVFYCHPLYPREGYFLWSIGMFMVLFSIHSPSARQGQMHSAGSLPLAPG
jgi:hypothetical protein